MGSRTYKATGVALRGIERCLGMGLRGEGVGNLVERPTLFVVNHFTRFETLLVPYMLYRHTRRPVRTLADHNLFHGLMGRYLNACGVMSTRDALRNRTIVSELMTRRFDWVIYPEGGLVKSKKLVRGREPMLELPHRQGPPHTGAAVLALQAELHKRTYLEGVARGDDERMRAFYERFGIASPEEIFRDGIVVVPVTITYYPMRSERRTVNRLLELARRRVSARVDEELQVEGTMLLGGIDMSLRFGEPIEVGEYLRGSSEVVRGLVGQVSEHRAEGLFIRRKARRLTRRFMRAIYENLEVNLDHLFFWAIRALSARCERIEVDRLRRALYLTVCELRERDDVHLHPSLRADVTGLVAGHFEALERAVVLAEREGVLREEDGWYVIDGEALEREVGFQRMRLERMSAVIANELEPMRSVVRVLERMLGLGDPKSSARVGRRVLEHDRAEFESARAAWTANGGDARQMNGSDGEGGPFLLNGQRTGLGVVLVHGYLSSPEEMRPLAERLHGEGFNVYGVRLDGHGTVPKNLTSVRWEGWVRSILRGCAVMRHHCDRLVVGGFSLGGTLALHVASMRSVEPAGVFSINAPMRLRDRRARLVPLVARWDAVRRSVGLGNGHMRRSNEDTESPDINYREDYVAGLAEMLEATRRCRGRLGEVRAPVLVVQAMGDPVVLARSGRMIWERLGTARKELVELALDHHVIVRGESGVVVGDRVAGFVQGLMAEGEGTAAGTSHG